VQRQLARQLAKATSDLEAKQAQCHELTQRLVQQRFDTLQEGVMSIKLSVSRRHGDNILLSAEEVHGLQNRSPQVCCLGL